MKYLFSILIMAFLFPNFNKSAYEIYNKKGKEINYGKMLNKIKDADIILFGELHNNPIAHWLQLELTQDLFNELNGNLILGAEMFESDNQLLIDEYFSGKIRNKNFEEEMRLWNNYKTDYKPLLEFANTNEIPFIATNIPRRYASMVFHKGINSLEDLSDEAKVFLPPLPIEVDLELPGYKSLLEMSGGEHGGENFPHAQAVKDAAMGYFISENLEEEKTFIHYNGAYHSDNFEGISWYINQYKPGKKIVTISTVSQENMKELNNENKAKADFIICIPENMTKTY